MQTHANKSLAKGQDSIVALASAEAGAFLEEREEVFNALSRAVVQRVSPMLELLAQANVDSDLHVTDLAACADLGGELLSVLRDVADDLRTADHGTPTMDSLTGLNRIMLSAIETMHATQPLLEVGMDDDSCVEIMLHSQQARLLRRVLERALEYLGGIGGAGATVHVCLESSWYNCTMTMRVDPGVGLGAHTSLGISQELTSVELLCALLGGICTMENPETLSLSFPVETLGAIRHITLQPVVAAG